MIIGIGGPATAGKDTFALFLESELSKNGTTMKTIGFSTILDECLQAFDPIIEINPGEADVLNGPVYMRYTLVWDRYGYEKAKRIKDFRRALLVMGTEVGRNLIHKDVWIDATLRKVEDLQKENDVVVVTGVRYPNEVEALRAAGALLVYVDRPGLETKINHTSEGSVTAAEFDKIVLNDEGLTALHTKAEEFSASILQHWLGTP